MSDFAVAASYDVRGFVAFESKPKTATQRSTARRHRAAKVIPAITLDGDVAKSLADVTAATGENVAACVRRLITDEALRLRKATRLGQVGITEDCGLDLSAGPP